MEQNETRETTTDVLLVGYGPVGATMALFLGRYGIKSLVVDKAEEIFRAPRAIALDNEALRILQLAGVPETGFARVAVPFVRMRSPVFGEFGRINSAGTIDGQPKLVTFYQPELEEALRNEVSRQASVTVRLGLELQSFDEGGDGVDALLRDAAGQEIRVRSRYIVGADGANSRLRQLIGEDFTGETYPEDWLVVDAKNAPEPIDHVEFICDPRRPTPHMVAPGGRQRWEFMLRKGESREEMESDATITRLLAPWIKGRPVEIERRAVYRFHARTAAHFRKGRAFLIGDAAHITPPFVGQGLVAGLRDCANLTWKLAWVLRGQAGAAILDTYDEERRPHAAAMINLAKFMGRLIMPTNLVKAALVHGLMRLTRLTPAMRAYFDELGIKPKNAFARGLFVAGVRRKLANGAWFPQGLVRTRDGAILLSDDALGGRLALVGLGTDAVFALTPSQREALAAAGGVAVRIGFRDQSPPKDDDSLTLEDMTGAFTPGVGPVGWALLIRPDRTILHQGPAERLDAILTEGLALLRSLNQQPTLDGTFAQPIPAPGLSG